MTTGLIDIAGAGEPALEPDGHIDRARSLTMRSARKRSHDGHQSKKGAVLT